MIKKYVKKPVTIEAIQWTGDNTHEICVFVGDVIQRQRESIIIPTLEGDHMARVGDYIIKGVQGEFYPCKPDIFKQTYDEVAGDEKPRIISTATALAAEFTHCVKSAIFRAGR